MKGVPLFDINSCMDTPLVNLGVRNSAFEGVYAPAQELGKDKIGVTAQFLENADSYHQAYSATPYFRTLLQAALSRIGFTKLDATILDIGSGSGNSALPRPDVLPQSRIIATDISENLLAILVRYINGNAGYMSRVMPIC